MKLFQYEMKKLLLNKKVFIMLLVLFIFYATLGFGQSYMSFGSLQNYKTFDSLSDKVEGAFDKSQGEKSDAAYQMAKDRYGVEEGITHAAMTNPQLNFDVAYHEYATEVKEYNEGSKDDNKELPYGVEPVKERLLQLEKQGKINTYEYNKLKNQLETSNKLGQPEYSNVSLWNNLYKSWGGYMILMLLFFPIAYFVAPIYTKEVVTGMDNIILSSKNGQRNIVIAKIAAVSIASAVITIIYFVATFIGNFLPFMSLEGISASVRSISSMVRAPFGFTVGQFALLTIAWEIIIAIVFGLVMTFISAKMRSHSAAFGIGIVLLLANLLMKAFGTNILALILPLFQFGFLKTADVTAIFGDVTSFNVFGMVVPYWLATLGVILIASIIIILLIFDAQKRRVITK